MTTVKQADFSHGIPVVSSSADRDARYPAPDTNARVHNLGTGYVERYDGSQWVAAIPTAAGGQTFDIKAYGAVGDGTTDNTTAISKAIAAAQAAGGGIVSVPPGTFGHKGIVLSSGVSLIGAGKNSVLKRLSSATALLPVDGESVTDVEIAHLTFDSGFAAYSAAGVYGLYLNNATRVTVHHCWVTGYTENGIAVEGTSSRIQITNNHITADTGTYPNTASDGISLRSAISGTNNYGTPLAATVTDCVVSGNTITGGRWGISVTNAARCSLTGNTIRDQTDRNIILFAGTSYTTVNGNTCDTCGGTNIILSSGCLHNTVTGNVCRNANGNRGLSGEMIGIEAYYDSDYNTITGNTVESPGTSGIRVAYGSRFVSVVGNTVRGAGGSGILVAQGTDGVAFAGYVERDLTDVLVTGNAVDGGNAIVKVFRDVGTGYSRRVVVLANGGQNQTSLGYSFATTRDLVFTPTGPTNAPFGQVSVSDVTYSADAIREFDVRRFGAVGDGTTDDTAAIQAAYTAASAASTTTKRSRVLFPAGSTFLVNSSITHPVNVATQIEGTVKAGASMTSVFTGPGGTNPLYDSRVDGDGFIDGNSLATHAINFAYARNCTVRHINVWRTSGSGIVLGNLADQANCGYGNRIVDVTVKWVADFTLDTYLATPTVGAFGIENYTSDTKIHDSRVTGFENGVLNYGGNCDIDEIHAWAPRNGGTPGDGTGGTMKKGLEDHGNGNNVTRFYADTPILYGLHLYSTNYNLANNRIYNGIYGGTINTLKCIRFENTQPFSKVANTNYLNGGSLSIAQDIEVNGGDLSSLEISGQMWSGTVTAVTKNQMRSLVAPSLRVGQAGTGNFLNQIVLYDLSLTPTAVSANSTSEQTFTATGLSGSTNGGDRLICNPPGLAAGLGICSVRVWSADTIAIKFINVTAGSLTPASGTYRVIAIRGA